MKSRSLSVLLVALTISLLSCSTRPGEDALNAALKPVRDHHAPDRRVAVFTVTPVWEGSVLVAKGDVDNQQARIDALDALRMAAKQEVVDSIEVLPDPALGDKRYGIVMVSVANVRTKPGQSAELANQLLMGMVVNILKERHGWYYTQSHDRYLGWVEESSLNVTDRAGVEQWADAKKIIVTDYFGVVRSKPNRTSLPVTDVVEGVLLKRGGSRGPWMGVELPDGRTGYLESNLVHDYASWRHSRRLTPDNVETTAKLFVGVPYLWGGTSAKGFDCSGYTKTVFRLNGLELNRDANQQATQGEDVPAGPDFSGLRKGDLLFFGRKATADKPERIWHVGIYLGHEQFIHCAGRVRINSFDPSAPNFDPDRLKTFVRARRVIGISQIPEIG